MKQYSFALIGAAGFVAPRHMRAIKETGNILKVALDPNDSIGVIDSYFPQASFFTEFERFDRHVHKLSRTNEAIDYISICSPNYLHDAHVRFALRAGSDAICEKPLVLNPWNIDALSESEKETGKRVNTILQLRLHKSIIALKKRIQAEPNRIYDVDLTYITSRGVWYQVSWKGNKEKSGGIATNIGVHFFDMLHFLFGENSKNVLHYQTDKTSAGYLEFSRARVRWFLSVDRCNLPETLDAARATYRSITIDGQEIEFSGGFTDLHTSSYEEIIQGRGFGLSEVRSSIEMVASIRTLPVTPNKGDVHPMARNLYPEI
ncbi:Gfo/Idh/MocA family protein [Thalassospira xiamenensis]|uniref:Gfo/Idh/MocA family protein n=1 Tax=Thalassospira xiamenensis TaxID=220697 RepID=UPI000DED47F8|nr:Gfo/Idh/MocA family oxidoreductase [Thalassospira xiamenensis]RCK33590.1 oxidoreductase [Thalassospira xiamenensis]